MMKRGGAIRNAGGLSDVMPGDMAIECPAWTRTYHQTEMRHQRRRGKHRLTDHFIPIQILVTAACYASQVSLQIDACH